MDESQERKHPKNSPPITFWSLPKELRDKIYEYALWDEPYYTKSPAMRNQGQWFPLRNTFPGYYRPLLHMHWKDPTASRWEHGSDLAEEPSLFAVAPEARDFYLRSHVLLELSGASERCGSVSRWQEAIGETGVEYIRKLYVLYSVEVVEVDGHLNPALLDSQEEEDIRLYDKTLKRAYGHNVSFVGPHFCIEIRDDGKELVLLSRARLHERYSKMFLPVLQEWGNVRAESNELFTGKDVIDLAKVVPKGLMAAFIVDSKDVLTITRDDPTSSTSAIWRSVILTLSDRHPHVVMAFHCASEEVVSSGAFVI
jgi:hypothetical protein